MGYERNLKLIEKLHRVDLDDLQNLSMLYDMALAIADDDITTAKYEMKIVKNRAALMTRKSKDFVELYWNAMLFLAQNRCLDEALIYLERYRLPEDRFYLPRRKQLRKLGIIDALQKLIDDEIDILTISCPPGVGKAQPLYSKVLTPDGFIRMGDVKVGTKVISGENRVSTVVGVYPQGIKKVYEVTFDDGSKTRCSDEHLWKVQTRDDRKLGKYRVVELQSMLHNVRVEKGKRLNYSVDYVEPISFPDRTLRLHPYVMGVLLGDGCLSGTDVKVSLPDEHVRHRLEELLPSEDQIIHIVKDDYRVRRKKRNNDPSETCAALREYGLMEHHSHEKFIPEDYMYASVEDRRELLAGLLDTDGYASHQSIEYTTTSPRLAEDVVALVHSLGGYASTSTKKTWYTKDGERVPCKDAYRIVIQFTKNSDNPFTLPRKAERYVPRRQYIKRFIKSIEHIGDEECQCIMIDDPCHLYITDDYIITHNTTVAELFLSLWVGWDPDACNLFSSHSGHVTRMVYDVLCNIIGIDLKRDQVPEYAWREIFPTVPLQAVNAKEETINLGRFKAFKSITCRAIGASQTGVTRADGLLYCDDLCSGIEEALSKVRLDKLWAMYSTDLKTRKKGGRRDSITGKSRKVKELHIATRWSVWDVIGRLQRQYSDNPRCMFIAYPDIDPVTEQSNWEYEYGVGFDTEYFHDIENTLDPITYRCLYKNEPVEREGLLFEPDILRRYKELPPDKEPDAIWAFLDPKGTGGDYNSLGVFYQYGADYYLEDVVFRNIDPYLLDDLNAACLVRNNVQICQIESNKEGVRSGDIIQEKVKERGGRCVIEKKFATANKETRIIVNSPWVIQHVLFKEPRTVDYEDGYVSSSEYGQFMGYLTSYSQLAKNDHDDAPDMVTMLAIHEAGDASFQEATIYGGVL